MKIKELSQYLENIAPLNYQESYDNAGLIVGNGNAQISGVLITLDVTEDIVNEAIQKNANLIIAHHPIVFKGLKRFNGSNYVERTVILAIKNDIAIYAAHTNLDNVANGVNAQIAKKLNLKNCRILVPKSHLLRKLVSYVPEKYVDTVRQALFSAGAGQIGDYDNCSFSSKGEGTFRANENANPFVGKANELHKEPEIKIETIFPSRLKSKIIAALIAAHPYEEVAYDIFVLENKDLDIGSGMIGELESPIEPPIFLQNIKEKFNAKGIRYTNFCNRPIRKVAFCGGSGSFLLKNAIHAGADIFITGDFTYHSFFDAEGKIIIADIGHYESEQFTKELFYEIITEKFSTFACYLSEINTNPINYLQ